MRFLGLWQKIENYFDKKKTLQKPKKKFELNDTIAVDSDDARALVFEVGEKLGFDALSCDTLIGILGNPISALKYLVAAGREGRKLAVLEQGGLLRLPVGTTDAIVLQGPKSGSRRTGGGVEVLVKKSRRKRKEP